MLRILLLVFLFQSVLSSPSALAEEKTPSQGVTLDAFPGETRGSLPFEVSLGDGRWVASRPGKLFTSEEAPDFVLPMLKEKPTPIRYPRWAVREGWKGTLIVAVEIFITGDVGRWKVMQSTGYPLLDGAATQAVRGWHFHPATKQGKRVVSCIQIPIDFVLEE